MRRLVLPALALLASVQAAAQSPRKLKVYISADMEGITGVVTNEQLGPAGFEYQRARQFMTDEVNAAIQGARDAGATEILVSDSHGNGQNILIDQLPQDVRIIRSWPRPLMMMEGIDASVDAALFLGYHSGTANAAGVRAHTMSSATLTGVALNGSQVPEGGINAAIAGHFNVPIVMISGDDAAIEEVRKFTGPIEGAQVKRAISFHAAETMTPKAGQELIRARAKAGVERRASFRPYKLEGPINLDVSFKHYRMAEIVTYLPGIRRVDAHTIRFTGRDILEVSRFLEFLNTYSTDLTP
jgi:D-amino peptidase